MSINLKATDARVSLKAQGSSFELKGSLGNTKLFTPLAHYKMNDNAASTVVVDSGSGGNNGVSENNTSTMSVTGKINNALDFNGTENIDVADVGAITNFDNTDDYSISVWIKSSTKSDQSISEHWEGGGGYPWALRGPDASGFVAFAAYDLANNPRVTSTSDLSDGAWHHIVGTKNASTKELKLYIDGALETELTYVTLNSTKSGNEGFAIGARLVAGTKEFTGSIDDFRIYDRTLTSDEVEELYNGGDGTEENNISRIRVPLNAQNSSFELKGSLGNTKLFSPTNHWKMNEASGTTTADSESGNTGTMVIDTQLLTYYPFNGNANDESSNSNNGVVTGATLTTDRFSASNKAYNFSGTGHHIDSTVPTMAAPYTVSFWYKPNTDMTTGATSVIGLNTITFPIIAFFGNNGGRLLIYSGQEKYRYSANNALTQDTWHHIVCVVGGTNVSDLHIYIDGVLADGTGGANTGVFSEPTNTLTIGGNARTDDIDEVMLFNIALSANEIADLYELTNVRDLNTSPFVTGKINNGIELDGLNLLDLDSSITLDKDSSSVCFWVNITTNLKSEGFVVLSNTKAIAYVEMITLYQGGGGNIFYMEPTTNNVPITWTEPSSLSGWHHIAFIMSTGGVPTLYIDGVDQGAPNSVAKTVAESFPIQYIGGGGGHAASHYGRFVNAKLDDIRIYDRVLTRDEVEEIYNAGSGTEGDNISRIRITLKGGD